MRDYSSVDFELFIDRKRDPHPESRIKKKPTAHDRRPNFRKFPRGRAFRSAPRPEGPLFVPAFPPVSPVLLNPPPSLFASSIKPLYTAIQQRWRIVAVYRHAEIRGAFEAPAAVRVLIYNAYSTPQSNSHNYRPFHPLRLAFGRPVSRSLRTLSTPDRR